MPATGRPDATEICGIRRSGRLAEGAGFEPAIRLIAVYTLSRRAPSTTRPPLLYGAGNLVAARGVRNPGRPLSRRPPRAAPGGRGGDSARRAPAAPGRDRPPAS